jgi:hypothetical protein
MPIQRIIEMLCAPFPAHFVWQLRAKPEIMYLMRKCMPSLHRCVKVIVEIMYMHIPVAETPSWRDMEIAHNFIYPHNSFDSASLFPLRVEAFTVSFAFTLLNALTPPKRP